MFQKLTCTYFVITYAMIIFIGKAQTIPLLKSYVDKTFGKK